MISGDPYPIKGLIVYGTNLLNSVPDPERTKRALAALDFVLVIDVLPQEHVAWADVVLPEATYLERYDDLSVMAHKTPFITLREPAAAPPGDTKPGWWIARELGLRVGLDSFFRWETIEDWLDRRLISVSSSLEKLRQSGGVIVQPGAPYLEDHAESPFSTPSGKIELFSQALQDAGLDPMPFYEEIEQPQPGWYRLLYGRHPVHTFAKTQNTPIVHDLYPENEVWLNAAEAAAAGVDHGDRVWLENQDGARSGPIKVKATQRIRSDAVFLVHGFGQDAPGLTRANGRGQATRSFRLVTGSIPCPGGGHAGQLRPHREGGSRWLRRPSCSTSGVVSGARRASSDAPPATTSDAGSSSSRSPTGSAAPSPRWCRGSTTTAATTARMPHA